MFLALLTTFTTWSHAAEGREESGPPWSHVLTVDRTHSADVVLGALFHQIAALGIGDAASAHLLKAIGESLAPEIARRGKAELSIGMLVDAVTAAKAAKWSAEDMTRLVLALDGVLDEGHPGDPPRLRALVQSVRHGATAEEILGTGGMLNGPADCCSSATADRQQWSRSVNVIRPGQEDALLEAAFHAVVESGVETPYAAQVIGDLNRYVHARTAAGEMTAIDMGLIVAAVRGGYGAGWLPTDSSRLLLVIQAETDREQGHSLEWLRSKVASVKRGRTVDDVLRSDGFAVPDPRR